MKTLTAFASMLVAAQLVTAGPGWAAGGGGHGKSGASNRVQASWTLEEPEEVVEVENSPRLVDMPILVTPLVVDGRLVNYAFVTMRLDVAEGYDPWSVREKTAFVRDAMLRAAHSEPLNPEHDGRSLDRERAVAVWLAAANRALGEDIVQDIRITAVDTRHPDLAFAPH